MSKNNLNVFECFPFSDLLNESRQKGLVMWVQNTKDSGFGPSQRFAPEDRRVYLDLSIGGLEPLGIALLDLMERDIGGHADRHEKYNFRLIKLIKGGTTHILSSAQVCAIPNEHEVSISINIFLPGLSTACFVVRERKFKMPTRTSQKFNWAKLDDEGLERLLYRYFDENKDFCDVQWLQNINSPDSGRDISARLTKNGQRVMIQARHRTASVSESDISQLVNKAETWNPNFDHVFVVTTGSFTENAIRWYENHNSRYSGLRPEVTLISGEMLAARLVRYPSLIVGLGIRS